MPDADRHPRWGRRGVLGGDTRSLTRAGALRVVRFGAGHLTALGQLLLALTRDRAADDVLTRELRSSAATAGITRQNIDRALSLARLSGVAIAPARGPVKALGGRGAGARVGDRVVAAIELDARDFDQVESVLDDLKAAAHRLSVPHTGR